MDSVQLDLCRVAPYDEGLKGKLFVNGIWLCDTIEPPYKNRYGAIPQGDYPVVFYKSQKFGRDLPVITCVSGRSGIEFHSGNYPYQSKGCVIVGYSIDDKCKVIQSKVALNILCSNLIKVPNINLTVYDMFV